MQRPKHEIVLRALHQGRGVRLGGHEFYLSEENDICAMVQRIDIQSGATEDVLIASGMTLRAFLDLCAEAPDDYIAGLAMDLALQASKS